MPGVHRYIRLAFSYGVGAREGIADPTAWLNALPEAVRKLGLRAYAAICGFLACQMALIMYFNLTNVVPLTCNYFVNG